MVMQRRFLPPVLCAVLLLALPLQTASAQSGGDSAVLTLDECRRTALANNLDLVSARRDPAIAEQQIDVSLAPFDGVIGANASYFESEGDSIVSANIPPTPDFPASSEFDRQSGDLSFTHLLKYGGSYSLTYNLSDQDSSATQIESSTGFLTQSASTQMQDGLTLTYEMPLLGGFGREVNTLDLLLARSGLDISREDLRLQAMLTLNSVEDAYWDVVATREALRIARLALDRAHNLLELNVKKVEVGTLAPIEITQAEAGVASNEEDVIVAEVALENAEDALLQLLAIPQNSPLWEESLELVDRPSYAPVDIDLDEAVATAMERRPETATARQRLRDTELSERVSRKGVRHSLDLTASLTPDQQTDSELLFETPPGTVISQTATDDETTNWSVALTYGYAIRNRRAKANHAIARLNREKSEVGLRNAEQSVRVDVRVAVRNLESGLKRIEAASKNAELQRKKLDAEEKKFDNGMSTSFEVLTFQNDLASAELAAIRAGLDHAKSLTAFERAKGTLLEARGLTLE